MKRRSLVFIIGRALAVPIFKLLFHYKVKGKKNLPKEGAYIVCPNHLSNADPMLVSMTQKRQIYYMAKAELFKNPIASAMIRELGAFPVERGAGDGKAIETAEEVVKDGRLLGIFIEGTRSKTGEFLRPKSGAAVIAFQTKTPVIPVCVTPKNKKNQTVPAGSDIMGKAADAGGTGAEGRYAVRAAKRQPDYYGRN
jgi:1-acyl-sn-glycerol-3-phosphate acyltransferase